MNTNLAGRLACLLMTSALLSFTAAAQAPGTLDTQFGTNGSTQVNFSIFQANCTAMALQNDGKMVLAGQYVTNGQGYLAFTRLNSDGTLDTGFGTGDGKAILTLNNSNISVTDIYILSNGKIIAAGNSDSKPTIFRLTSTGAPDVSFGTNGFVSYDGDLTALSDLVVLPNGQMVGCGIADQGNGKLFAAFRANADGSLDSSFGTNGFAYANVGLQPSMTSMAIQLDGKILLTGTVYTNSTKFDLALFRFNANGTPDASFGTNGKVVSVLYTNLAYEQGNAIYQQLDGKIVVAGRIANAGPTVFVVVRYNADGTIDNAFGTSGSIRINYFNSLDEAKAVQVQADGKIVVVGTALNGSNRVVALARLTKDGALDNTFGTGGKTTTAIGTKAYGEAMAITPDNNILVAGSATVSNISRFSVARYFGGTVLNTAHQDAGFRQINIYPNPVSTGETITLRFDLEQSQSALFQLLSIDGRLLHSYNPQMLLAGDQSIELAIPEALSPGQTMLRIETERGVQVMRLLIQG